jgi:hypothetical protein
MTRLFNLAAGMGLPSARYARFGQAHTGDLQKRRYTTDPRNEATPVTVFRSETPEDTAGTAIGRRILQLQLSHENTLDHGP